MGASRVRRAAIVVQRENVSHENVDATPQQYRSTTVEHVPKAGAQDYRPGTVDRGTQFQQPVQQQPQTQQQTDTRSGREYHRAQQPSSTQPQPQQEIQQRSREVQSPQYPAATAAAEFRCAPGAAAATSAATTDPARPAAGTAAARGKKARQQPAAGSQATR